MRAACIASFLIAACASPPSPQPPSSGETAAPPPAPPAASPSPTASATEAEPAKSPSAVPERDLGAFERVLEAAVHSVAFGKGASVAALGSEAFVDRGKGFEKLPKFPRRTEHVSIYFGRDDQPRAMGYELKGAERHPVYLRFRGGAWQSGASEIAKLGNPAPGALFGVLGWDDPEVVCKERELCIIKRLTGWTMIPVLDELSSVVLCQGGEVYAHAGARVLKLAPKRFEPLTATPSFQRADALACAPNQLFVVEHATSRVHALAGDEFVETASPIAGPRSAWAAAENDVWLAGDGGVAHFDGQSWARVAGAPTSATLVTGPGRGEPWVATAQGLYRLRPRTPPKTR